MRNICILDVASQEVLYLYIKDPLETKNGVIDPTWSHALSLFKQKN